MSTKKKRSRKKQKVYTVHWPILMGLTALLVALVLLVVGVIRACALPEGDALTVEESPEPIIPAPTWSPLPVDIDFTKVHNTYVKVFMQDEGEIRDMLLEEYVLGVVAGALVGNFVKWGIASVNAMAVACVCYLVFNGLFNRNK